MVVGYWEGARLDAAVVRGRGRVELRIVHEALWSSPSKGAAEERALDLSLTDP